MSHTPPEPRVSGSTFASAVQDGAAVAPVAGDDPATGETGQRLERNAIGLPAVLFQGISTIAPAFGLAIGLAFTVSLAGQTAPLVFLMALVFVVVIAINVGQLAKAFPSAGGFYTYVSRTVHPRVGFLCGWVFILWLPPSVAIAVSYIAFAFIEPELKGHYGWNVPWWLITLVVAALVSAAAYFGIRASGRVLVIAGSIEILVMIALGVSGFVDPGPGGFNFGPFNPANSPSLQGLYLGTVFTIFAYSGWETTTPLAEESRRPRRDVPIALVLSVLLVGLMYLVTSWGALIGLGTDKAGGIASLTRNPFFVLADKLWGPAWVILLLALINSGFATALGGFNGAIRMWFAMGRSGSLPRQLAVVHPKYKTPINAIWLQIAVIAVTFSCSAIWRPDKVLFVWALSFTLGLILVYVATAVGVVRHYRLGPGRAEFNYILHLVFPIVGSAAALWVGYKSLVPLPAPPSNWAPVVGGVWLLIGVGILVALRARGSERWLHDAGRAFDESGSAEPGAVGGR